MAENNKVTIDAAWFAELFAAKKDKDQYAEAVFNIAKERDALKAKLSTAQNHEDVIAAKNREIEGVKQERNRLNAKVNELMAKLAKCEHCHSADEFCELQDRLAAAERCIEDVFNAIENDCSDEVNKALAIIRAYREKKEAK